MCLSCVSTNLSACSERVSFMSGVHVKGEVGRLICCSCPDVCDSSPVPVSPAQPGHETAKRAKQSKVYDWSGASHEKNKVIGAGSKAWT